MRKALFKSVDLFRLKTCVYLNFGFQCISGHIAKPKHLSTPTLSDWLTG